MSTFTSLTLLKASCRWIERKEKKPRQSPRVHIKPVPLFSYAKFGLSSTWLHWLKDSVCWLLKVICFGRAACAALVDAGCFPVLYPLWKSSWFGFTAKANSSAVIHLCSLWTMLVFFFPVKKQFLGLAFMSTQRGTLKAGALRKESLINLWYLQRFYCLGTTDKELSSTFTQITHWYFNNKRNFEFQKSLSQSLWNFLAW